MNIILVVTMVEANLQETTFHHGNSNSINRLLNMVDKVLGRGSQRMAIIVIIE